MRSAPDLVDARHMGQSFATDRDLTLPARPRLIPELVALPLEADGLMLVGGEEPQVFRGRSARVLLPQLLPLLDGEHTLGEIVARRPSLRAADVRDAVSLLFSRGLLEDGLPRAPLPELVDVAGFLGRHVDASRRHASREAALRCLASASVSVVGAGPLAESLASDLRAAGVGSVRVEDGAPFPADLAIVLSSGATAERARRFEPAPGGRTLLVRLGRDEAHIGPLLADGVTACPECVARAHPHPQGEPEPLRAALWIGLASLQAFLALSQISSGMTLRGFRVQRVEGGELSEETRLAVRLPGCARCGMAGEPWATGDPRMLAWIYHCATSLPSRAMLSPKDHQAHYLVAHTRLAAERRRLVWSPSSEVLPVRPLGVTAPEPASAGTRGGGAVGELDAAMLSSLLLRTAGEIREDGQRRRLVPTGGNLGSVNLWVIARQIAGLAPGAYLYDAPRQALDFVRAVDDGALRDALRTDAPLPDCLLAGAGGLAKCAQKYQAFAYRLIHFDAGVALAFAHLTAGALGITPREHADFDLTIPRLFGTPIRWEMPYPTFALGIGPGASTAESAASRLAPPAPLPPVGPADYSFDMLPRLLDAAAASPLHPAARRPDAERSSAAAWAPSLEALDRLLLARRAVREYAPAPVPADALREVAAAASDALARRLAAGAPACFARPVLAVAVGAEGLAAGLYRADLTTGDWRRCGDFSPALADECSNQRSLAAAPATLFLIGDLRAALTERGCRGYSELAVHAGAAVGEAWLRATSLGLVGTAAGGVIAGGLRRAAGMDGFNECPLLALHLGRPSPGAS